MDARVEYNFKEYGIRLQPFALGTGGTMGMSEIGVQGQPCWCQDPCFGSHVFSCSSSFVAFHSSCNISGI